MLVVIESRCMAYTPFGDQRDRYCFKNQTFWMKSEVF